MRSAKVQKEIDEAKKLAALAPLFVPNRDRSMAKEHITEEHKTAAKALLVMMRSNQKFEPLVIECLKDIACGCEHVCSRPAEYINGIARGYGYPALGVHHV